MSFFSLTQKLVKKIYCDCLLMLSYSCFCSKNDSNIYNNIIEFLVLPSHHRHSSQRLPSLSTYPTTNASPSIGQSQKFGRNYISSTVKKIIRTSLDRPSSIILSTILQARVFLIQGGGSKGSARYYFCTQ